MNAVKIVSLKLSPRQFQVLQIMKSGITSPAKIAKELHVSRKAVAAAIGAVQRRNRITHDELHVMLPFIALVPPTTEPRRKPTVYQRGDRWLVRHYTRRIKGKQVMNFIAYYPTEAEAIAAWKACERGLPPPEPPFSKRKSNKKPLVYPFRGKWRALLWLPERQRNLYIGTFDTEPEALAAWYEAKANGVYTKNGLVKL